MRTRKMGVAPARAPGSIFLQIVQVLVIFLLLQDVVAQQDQIVFNAESTAYVLEEQPVGTVAAVLEAFYLLYSPFQLGTDGIFTLNTSQPDAQFFTIESAPNEAGSTTLGMLRTAAVLDRDAEGAQTTFALTVTYSTPDGYLSSQRSITVLLNDVNDNPPLFTEAVYSVALLEDAAPGSPVIHLTANDVDQVLTEQLVDETGEDFGDLVYLVDHGRVFYSITGGNEIGNFQIDSEGGTIFVSPGATFDVDVQEAYNLTILAMDAPGLNSTTLVKVNILDSNDNPPQILAPRGLNLTLPEDTPTGLVILEAINATDEDRGLNAEIQFLIISGDDTDSFSIDPSTGKIILTAPLDREGGTGEIVTLVIAARDQGIPPLQDTIDVIIFITDINDFPPSFQQDSYMESVTEGVRSGIGVLQVVALDRDEGPGGVVSYSIIEGSDGNFDIDPEAGEIFTNATFDREERSWYQLTIEAVDNPLNVSFQLSASVNVTITIEDRNDNVPIFNQSLYEINILDNLTRGTDVIQISAYDSDDGVNAEITYQFVDPLPNNSTRFRIRENTGLVLVNFRPRIDFGTIYNFTIQALDGGTPPLHSEANLIIYIHDVDETPPMFEQDAYNVTLNETVDVGSIILKVEADDPDPGPIGEVRYRIISDFDEAGSFAVNPETGEINVTSRLDFDARNFSFFQVEAYDGGFPEPFTDVTNVTVFLLGENDEPPSIIFPEGYFPTVPEDEPPGYEIVYLSNFTTDPDMGLGGEFNFSLFEIYDPLSEGVNESFSLNTTTGLLRSLRVFDREEQPQGITVAIETSDFGEPPQSTVTNITVMIGDKNDQVPYFPSNLSIVAYEFLPPGVHILDEYRAIDDDIDINAQLVYSIVEGDPQNEFSIDPHTGGLFTAATLNKTQQKFYNLTIIAEDSGTPQFHTFGQIEIEVIDANDQVPMFTLDTYTANVSENVPIGIVFFQVNASDADIGTNAEFQFFLHDVSNESAAVNERFTIDPVTGEIATNDVFDRENDTAFILHVIAVDNGSTPMRLTGSATVVVTIDDRNDHTPTLHNTTYTAEVIENAPNGTYVFSASASDRDAESPNNDFFFTLNGSRSDVFDIDPMSGDVTVAAEVDWEEGAVINIVVVVTDFGEPPQSSMATVSIDIMDVNDRAPEFTPGSLSLEIYENTSPPAPVQPRVTTVDPDTGNGSYVTYEVLMDLAGGRFLLDSETGEVTFVRGTLNRERRPSYELLIRASDHGVPQLYTDATLVINVLDANDFDPVFDEELFTGSIPENAPLGTTILTLGASDMDEGTNAELSFFIIEADRGLGNISDDSNHYLFSVNESTGDLVTISESFDFELRNSPYHLVVMVTDHGVPPRNHTSQVIVTITDFNDNPPIFSEDAYNGSIEENLSPYTTVLQVAASDVDTDTNQDIYFSLASGGGREYFDIDPNTGVLHTVRYIDRELTPSFELTVVANNSMSPHPVWSNVSVSVTILDLNDTHPSFDVVTNVDVPENAPSGSVVFNLTANDGDEGLAGSISYDIIHGNEDGVFQLEATTGAVVLLKPLDFEVTSLYVFVVEATDMATPNLMNYTNVVVHVLDVNENPPYFVSSEYTITVDNLIAEETVILDMVAEDSDSGTNSELRYEITEGSQLFALQSTTQPSLYVSQSLEDHAGETISLTVTVFNLPSAGTISTGRANVTIHIQQSLPTRPRFTQTSFTASVAENQDSVILLELSEETHNGDNYEIVAGNLQQAFTVDNAGTVSLNMGGLDYELHSTYQLTISANNTVNEQAFCILTITVTDLNDFPPEFISSSFLVHIPETSPLGEPFFFAMTTDKDGSSPANEVEVSFFGSVSEEVAGTFVINPLTGGITLERSLDFESGDRNFTFDITASNEMATSVPSVATVTIVVVNGNNHAPVFTSRILEPVVLYENQTIGISIFNATAKDEDHGSAGEITFGLKGNHRYFDFSIDTFTGEVTLSGQLDRERETQYLLELVAADRGNPGLTSTTLLVVGVQDINDNSPVWTQLEYSIALLENTSVGASVVVVEAEDIDQVDSIIVDGEEVYFQENGLVHYSITEGDPRGQFFIDTLSGVVEISAPLNREMTNNYTLTLSATDGGGRQANATLYITVLDINDVSPTFTQDEYSVAIPENSPNGTFLINVSATDTDLAKGAFFFYDIDAGNIGEVFAINASTGTIWLDLPLLDRETISVYNLTVVAVDLGDPPLTGSAEVLVHLLDLNEFPPVFDQEMYTATIPESTPLLSTVLNITTSDLDYGENATTTYSIVVGNNHTRFGIGPSSGELFVANPLDFEDISEYQLVVLATDSGPISTQLSSTANITVLVTDVNDNRPIFDNSSYLAVVREDTPPLTTLLTLQASDDDSGVNAEIVFSLDPLEEDSAPFSIDPLTGILSLSATATLDYENQVVYQFTAIATDSGVPQLNSTVPVTIEIADVNDNPPVYISSFFNATVTENLPPGHAVVPIIASDADSGENAVITYSIVRQIENESDCIATCTASDVCTSVTSLFPLPPFSYSPFTIHTNTGLVSTPQPLDRENRSSYLMAIKASDSGNETSLSSLTCLLVTVQDENDEYPTFPPDGYRSSISEFSGEGMLVAHVTASDDDLSSNAEIRYRVVEESGSFTIHPTTGEVVSLGGFDRELRDEYDVIVLATDGGEPPLNSTTVVKVTILDENDNKPLFNQSKYYVNFAENQPPFSSLLHLPATDADIGSNADLIYSIPSAIPQNHFLINSTSGLLTTSVPLDREEITSYLVTVVVTDMGNPPMSSSCQVNITVLDTNDHAPSFTQDGYFATVNENLTPDSPLVYIAASDDDIGTNSVVEYIISETIPYVDSFVLNPSSGALSLISPLDAEFSVLHTLTVIASNGGALPEQSSVTNVTVAVGDVNDHAPQFSRPDYVVTVIESTEVGSEVIQLEGTDDDATLANSEIRFVISGGQNRSLFSIDPHTGIIFVSAPLDREREPTHTLQVTVYDNGMVPGQLETTVSVTFVLQDANDNIPVFEQTSYLFSIHENNDSGIVVGRVRANDIDLQSVNYSLAEWRDGSGSGEALVSSGVTGPEEFFEISPVTGDIYTTTSFDREERDLYAFYVIATDNGTIIQHSSAVLVSVTILDRNDVIPSFSRPIYTTAWAEDTPPGTTLLAVIATDSDLEEAGRVGYFISPSNDSGMFSVNVSSGDLTLEGEFDREWQDSFQVDVIARDYGTPSLNSSVVLVVTVLDINDNIPTLNASEYRATLLEDTPLNSLIIGVTATDGDIGSNADITFSLSTDFNSTFSINGSLGVISLTAQLDYEYAQNYTFSVVVTDGGDSPLSSSADVFISVVDLNDNPPVFTSDLYYASVPENAILRTPVFQIPATDADSTSNGELQYSILAGNVPASFEVGETSGLISLSSYLDREITESYLLSLHVVDRGTPQFTALTELLIEVVDVNDHIPHFDSDAYFVSVPELSEIGSLVVVIAATDDDIGVNANLTYSISAGDPEQKFSIDPVTGEVRINGILDFETMPSYSLTVLVSDQGLPEAKTNTVILSISILDDNEYPPSYPKSTYIIDLPANTAPGSLVGSFIAHDEDHYTAPSLRYSLADGDNATFFAVNQHSGSLYTSSLLPLGELLVSLIAGDGLYTTSIDVTVVVSSLASLLPFFQPPSSVFLVYEDVSLGEGVGLLHVTSDNDDDVIFTLLNTSDLPFEVTAEGQINLIGQLDYETTPTYLFNVQATSISNSSLVSHSVVTIVIGDVNDNPPSFQSTQYSLVISELTPPHILLLTLAAYDLDSLGVNSEFQFSITEGNEGGNFTLDPLTGELTVAGVLDYEEETVIVLTVMVTNHLATPPLHSEAEVRVELQDENDHSPQFAEDYYQSEVASSATVGTPVLTLSATDVDSGSNAELIYSLVYLEVPLSFAANYTTGVVSTGSGFSSSQESYVIGAAVSDRGAPQPRSDTTTIFITLVPTNNFAPQFEMEGYSIFVPETLPAGGSVVKLSASDPDSADSHITYAIVSGDPDGIFAIDPSMGLLTLTGTLDYYRQPLYQLEVTAEDDGTPSKSSPVAVNISVEDVNNHAPIFSVSPYSVSIPENTTAGSSVLVISASDVDSTSIIFLLTVNSYHDNAPLFSLDNTTGLLTTAAALDREVSATHELLVSAVDSGYPVRLSNSVPVIITLIDLNDTPPQFNQSEYIFTLLRYLASDLYVGMVTATDSDLIGQQLMYDITEDTSGGLFQIAPTTGVISTNTRVPEDGLTDYRLMVTVFDGNHTTTVPVTLQLTSDGYFCEGSGLCTSVQPVNCSFIDFGSCDPRILGPLYDPFCTDPHHMLSPEHFLCISHYCTDPSLTPCLPAETCLPPYMACDGQCSEGTALCPTTQLCHVTSLRQSCDGSNITCLIGQILVEFANSTRECLPLSVLPPSAENCIEEQPYCIAIDECANITSTNPCRTCPVGQTLCPDTAECVASLSECCGEDSYFCQILDKCLSDGDVCQLPNVPPGVFTTIIHVESVFNFDPDESKSADGHMIRALLSNGSNNATVDPQGEEVSLAVVEISESQGAWQYTVCPTRPVGDCEWVTIEGVSEDSALLLPSTGWIRFLRRSVEVEGAVWMRVKLWDGNEDGYLSPSLDLVRYSEPHYRTTVPFSSTGAFSQNSTLLSVLLLPVVPLPSLPPHSSLTLSPVTEDTPITGNPGNTIEQLVEQVVVPELPVLPEEVILGLPDMSLFTDYMTLYPTAVQEYIDRIKGVNPTRLQRQSVRDQGLGPGIGIRLSSYEDGVKGQWQVSWNGDIRQYVYVDSLLSSTNQILLLNTTARIRFIPSPDYCGEVSIPFQPWDGYWNETGTNTILDRFLVTMDTALSQFHLNSLLGATQTVNCVLDKPVFLVNRVQLEPIPYFISYSYEHLFTVIISMETSTLRGDRNRLSELLHVTLEREVRVLRIAAASELSSQVSFMVEGEVVTFTEVQSLLEEKAAVLDALGFPITNISLTAYYGPGEGCSHSLSPLPISGVTVASLTNQIAEDKDKESLGVSVTAANSASEEGVWQYLRGNWSNLYQKAYSNLLGLDITPHKGPWINFPPGITESRALLLHPEDRIRYVPKPNVFWSTLPPSISIKAWDTSVGMSLLSTANEAFLSAINTDPFVDTTQSLFHTVGIFSEDTALVEASRHGCDDVINSGFVFDSCCVCGGRGEMCDGCDGVEGSRKTYDHCDVCGGDGGCEGCDLVPFSHSEPISLCEECVSVYGVDSDLVELVREEVGMTVVDCEEVCWGSGVTDDCGECIGGNSINHFNRNMDCAGMCWGNATVDDCGYCTGPGTMLTYNWNLDCARVCGGPFRSDTCGICQLPDENGVVIEHRDCLGVCQGSAILDECSDCYGESAFEFVGSSVDVCGVCGGQNSTCVGCDGSPASGVVVDSCGECGGNDCGCFKIDFIEPQWGPKSGGTVVLIHGAGFFLNDSNLVSFDFDPQNENCGAPREIFGGESVSASCQFASGQNNAITADDVTILNQSTIRCVTKATTADFLFDLSVSIETGPRSNAVIFRYYDDDLVAISGISPVDVEIDQMINVTFHGNDFEDTASSVCFVYDTVPCGMNTGEAPVVIKANYISKNEIVCTFPAAGIPCEVRVQLSLDGQTSGVVQPGELVFTYRFSAPQVELVNFSDDLADIVIQFDRQVEQGGSEGSQPACSEIFNTETLAVLGEPRDEACYWANSLQEKLVVRLPSSAQVTIHSQVSFRDGAIATRGQMYSYSISELDSFSINFSLDSVPPVAIINGPHSIPTCGDVEFTGIHSLNPGFGGMSYLWSVLTEDSTIPQYHDIIRYLDTLDDNQVTISLTSSWFVNEVQYYLRLVVVNSVGLESPPAVVPLVRDERDTRPQVFVLGHQVREITEGESVVIEADVFIPHCSLQSYQFDFEWQLYQITDERRGILSMISLSSLPSSSPILYLPHTILSHSSSFLASLTVTDPSMLYSETINVSISVSPREPRAIVHGGDRVHSVSRTLVLDARESMYNPSLAPPTFTWSCNVIGSGGPCYNQTIATPTPIIIPSSDLVSIPGSDLVQGLNYNFTVTVSQTDSIKSSYSVAILITNATPPIVEVIRGEIGDVTSQKVVIQGLIYSSTPVTSVVWETVDIGGHGYLDLSDPSLSLGQTSYTVSTGRVSSANLILPPNSLTPRLTYTFQLTATNEAGSSYDSVSITPDSPPHSAQVHVIPTEGGTSLETVFTISVEGTLDSNGDSPFLYQFGVSTTATQSSQEVTWLSGAQVHPSIETLLPSGPPPGHGVTVFVRVFDRNGGYSDAMTTVTVTPTAIEDEFIRELLNSLETEFIISKNWQNIIYNLTSIAMEIDSTPSLSPSLKQDALSLFLELFLAYLPASHTHYQLASQLLSLLTANTMADSTETIAAALTDIGRWFQGQSAIDVWSIEPVANGNQDGPLQLLPVEGVSSPGTHLPPRTAADLLATWSNIVSSPDTPADITASLVAAVELIGVSLCQGMVYGETPLSVTSSVIDVSVYKSPPVGVFNTSGNLVDFQTATEDTFHAQACLHEHQACFETCFIGIQYSFDLFNDGEFLQLTTTAEDMITVEIEGSNPHAIELLSNVLYVNISIPSQNKFLRVEDLEQEFTVLLQAQDFPSSNETIPLCLYREFGGTSGFSSPKWQLDTISPPILVEIDSVTYYQCSYNHLTEFAIGLLPPPSLPPSPSPVPSSSPIPSSTPSPPSSTAVGTPSPEVTQPQTGISPAVIAVPLLLVVIIAAIVVCVLVFFLMWKKKKAKVLPSEDAVGVDVTDGKKGPRLLQTGLLTPEESKVPMPIIELLESGERMVVGSMNVLPAIRLRELRYHILDHFASFKGKPFYFLTRQLVDIEPPTEQQQFVSLVYGEEADKPIFVRRVEITSDLTRLHFCVCGNAAQFECSSCSAQGYCSPECQTRHWAERHQRECSRLGEKKQRLSVLRRQSSTLSPVDEHMKLPSIFPEKQNMSAATPLDFRSLLNSQRSYQRPSFSSPQSLEPSVATPSFTTPTKPTLPPLSTPRSGRTTIGMLASQPRPPTIKEESEGEDEGEQALDTRPLSTPHNKPPFPRMSRPRLPPLSSTPARPVVGAPSPMAKFTTTPLSPSTSSPPHLPFITSPPSAQLFQRTALRLSPHREPPVTSQSKKLSIQSLGSVDFGESLPLQPPRTVRREADLESESDSSSSEGSPSRPPSTAVTTHLPSSLSMEGKKSAASKARSPSPSTSSSSSGSGSEASDSHPTTPLVTEQN